METQLSYNRPIWAPKPDDSYTASLYAIGTILRSRKSCKNARGSSYIIYDVRTGVGSGFGATVEIGSCAAIALRARGGPLSLR